MKSLAGRRLLGAGDGGLAISFERPTAALAPGEVDIAGNVSYIIWRVVGASPTNHPFIYPTIPLSQHRPTRLGRVGGDEVLQNHFLVAIDSNPTQSFPPCLRDLRRTLTLLSNLLFCVI